jgi:hypothetical protein
MGRRVDVDDLVSPADIAERMKLAGGKAAQAKVIHEWRYRDLGFPEPVATVGKIKVWAWPDVEKWARATGRIA